jgi:hypothetical protein
LGFGLVLGGDRVIAGLGHGNLGGGSGDSIGGGGGSIGGIGWDGVS